MRSEEEILEVLGKALNMNRITIQIMDDPRTDDAEKKRLQEVVADGFELTCLLAWVLDGPKSNFIKGTEAALEAVSLLPGGVAKIISKDTNKEITQAEFAKEFVDFAKMESEPHGPSKHKH